MAQVEATLLYETVFGDMVLKVYDVPSWPNGDYVATGMVQVWYAYITPKERSDATISFDIAAGDPAVPFDIVTMVCGATIGHKLMCLGWGM